MYRILFCLSVALWCPHLQAQAPLINNVPNRSTVSLDGKWRVIVDPMENGYYNYRYVPHEKGFFANEKPANEQALIEYDFDKADQLNVPGDWNTQRENLFYYEGTLWYKKSFSWKITDSRVFLHFGAVNYDAKVYLNGTKLGEHQGGFTAFNFEVTDKLREGENFVIVKVDNTRRKDQIPTVNSDWYNFGGITRSVRLVEVPQTFIRDFFVQLKKGSQNELEGWVQLDGPDPGQMVTVSIPEVSFTQTIQPDANGLARLSGKVKLQLWSPEAPKRYEVIVKSGSDETRDQIGFRSIEVQGYDILLNGKPVFLKGISIHEVAPFTSGRVVAREQCVTLLNWAKELGCNFVRLAHYQHNEDMVRLADEMGLMVWSEIPVYWTIDWQNTAVYENAECQLVEMITRDRNRVSIVMWSVANETPISEPRTQFLAQLVTRTRAEDNTRLVTGALEAHTVDGLRTIDDPFGAALDVIGINNYCGWYGGTPASCADVRWQMVYEKPLIVSEFGGGALQGLHGTEAQRWTEEYQEAVYVNNIEMLKNMPFLRGTTPWILMDFYSARRQLSDIQDFYNRKGLISERGIRKKAFFVLQKYYSEEPVQLEKR